MTPKRLDPADPPPPEPLATFKVVRDANTFRGRRNAAYRALHGLSQDVKAETHEAWLARIDPEDRDIAQDAFSEAFQSGRAYACEYRIRRADDGAMRWIDARGHILRDTDGNPVGLVGVHLDVTERRRREAELAHQQRLLQRALQIDALGVWTFDRATGALFLDETTAGFFGAPAAAVRSASALLALAAPESRPVLAAGLAAVARDPEHRLAVDVRVHDPRGARVIALAAQVDPSREPSDAHGLAWDVTRHGLREAERAFMLRELEHRLKNTFAVVQSMASQTLRSTPTLNDAELALTARIRALASAHELLFHARSGPVRLREVIDRIVASHAPGRYSADGPDALLAPPSVTPAILILHELATNALKHGALAVPHGRVRVRWRLERGGPFLHVIWRERGGREVVAPSRHGFGVRLIETTAAAMGGGPPAFDFIPEGLEVRFRLGPIVD